MRIILILITSLLILFDSQASNVVKISGNCDQGLAKLGHSSFSLYISCEGALGNYIGVMLTSKWSKFGNRYWEIGDRFWYEKSWGSDVHSYYYYSKKNMLYVATSNIYGIGGIYELNIKERKSRIIFPDSVKKLKAEDRYSIVGFKKNTLFIKVTNSKGKQSKHSLNIQ